jgi:hypothetical protein
MGPLAPHNLLLLLSNELLREPAFRLVKTFGKALVTRVRIRV